MQVVGTPKRGIYECCFDSVAGFDVANLVEPHRDILSCVAHDCSPRLQGANRNCNRRRMRTVALYPNDVGLDLLTLERYTGCANCAGSKRGACYRANDSTVIHTLSLRAATCSSRISRLVSPLSSSRPTFKFQEPNTPDSVVVAFACPQSEFRIRHV